MNLAGKYLSASQILSDILSFVGDEEGLVPVGFYYGQIRKALAELAYTTHFDERFHIAPIVAHRPIKLPDDLFDIVRVRVFSGSECSRENSHTVYSKPGALGGGDNYMADIKSGSSQDIINGSPLQLYPISNLLWYSENGGMLALSSSCWKFQKAFIEYSGIGSDFKTDPVIPYYLNQAVIDWVSVKALRRAMVTPGSDMRRLSLALREAKDSLEGNNLSAGSWLNAKRRVMSMHTGERDDLNNYLSSFGQPRP